MKKIFLSLLMIAQAIQLCAQSMSVPSTLMISDIHKKLCFGLADGMIDITVTGGSGHYQYSWLPGGSLTEDLSGLIAGSYTVTVFDQGTQEVSNYSVTLVEPAPINIYIHTENVACSAGNTGSAEAIVSGGTPGYTFFWSTGSTTQSIGNLNQGNYSVIVTDFYHCSTHGNAVISEPVPLTLALTSPLNSGGFNVSGGMQDGSVSLSVSGGTAPYGFLWSNGSFSQNLINLQQGNYSVQVTDEHNCTVSDQITLTSDDPLSAGGFSITSRGNWMNPNEDFIGTRNPAPVLIKTNNVEQMRIDENGNIGIGTMNPLEKLDVGGNVKIGGTLKLGSIPQLINSVTSQTTRLLVVNAAGEIEFTPLTQSFAPCSDPQFTGTTMWNTWGAEGQGPLPAGASTDMVFLCHPKLVGIGTDMPQAELDVRGTALFSGIGIGEINPSAQLHIKGTASIKLDNTDGTKTILSSEGNSTRIISNESVSVFLDYDNQSSNESFTVLTNDSWSSPNVQNLFSINHNGTAYVNASVNGDYAAVISNNGSTGNGLMIKGGTNTSNSLLSIRNYAENIEYFKVNGNASDAFTWARKMKVTMGTFSDFVFEKDYELRSLEELERYIHKHKHLPEIPSAEELKKNDMDLGEMQKQIGRAHV